MTYFTSDMSYVNIYFYCVNTSYLVDRCICPAPCRSRQTLEKNVLSWPGPVVSCSFARLLYSLPAGVLCMCAHAHFLFLFGVKIVWTLLLCQLTCQSADIMSSLCGVGVRVRVRVRVRVNNFSSKTTRPRDVLFFLKDTLSIEDEKLFKACKSVCSSVC